MVANKLVNARGAKGLTVQEPRLPEKVSQLRPKLGQKSKQEPQFVAVPAHA
jgi:hypothetical protein